MRFDILTIFPSMFDGPLGESIIKRAVERQLLTIAVHNIRDFATDRHHTTDDSPYGGGAGMVMKPDPIFAAVEHALASAREAGSVETASRVILMTPQGRRFDQRLAEELASEAHLVFVCGHYEGVDERVRQHLVTDEISIGDYVLTGGELPAMVIIDAVSRLLPGVLGAAESLDEESISSGLLEYPHYTRPFDYRGHQVPDVLLSGNHAFIARWRREQSLKRTLERRPDLLDTADLTASDRDFLAQLARSDPPR